MTLVIEEENRASWNQIFDLSNNSALQKSISAEDIVNIQKLPTWIQRPSIQQKQDKKVDEQKLQQIEELQQLRNQLAYQHFIMTEYYTEQNNYENNDSIKILINYLNENIVKESQELIQTSIELYRLYNYIQLLLYQRLQQKNLLWKMQEQLNKEHYFYLQMQIDSKQWLSLDQSLGKPDDRQINEAKNQLQKWKNSNIGCLNVFRFDQQLQLVKMIGIIKNHNYIKFKLKWHLQINNFLFSKNMHLRKYSNYINITLIIQFVVDNIRYEFDNHKMLWSTDVIEDDDNPDDEVNKEQLKKRGLKQIELREQVRQNEHTVSKLASEIQLLNDNINKYQEKLQQSQAEQNQLIDEYVHEHLETEKIKAARERLDKLKRELGL